MSVLSEKVRKALYTAMNVPPVTALATNGVHHLQAPNGHVRPYVIFQRQAPGSVLYGLANNLVGERDLWLIKAVTDKDSSETLGPTDLAEQILKACLDAIGEELIMDGSTTKIVRRVNDMPSYKEDLTDRVIYHSGFLLTIFTA